MMKVEMLSLHVLLKNSIVKIRQCFNTTSEVSKNDIHGRILDMFWWISRESYQIPKMWMIDANLRSSIINLRQYFADK